MDKKRLFKGLMTVAVFELLVMPFTFLLRILYARNLSVADYGLFYAMINFIMLINIFVDPGLSTSIIHYFSKFLKEKKYSLIKKSYFQIMSIEVFLSFILISLVLFFNQFIAKNYFHSIKSIELIFVFSFLIFFSIFYNLLVSFFMGVNDEKYYASMNPIRLFLVLIMSGTYFLFFKEGLLLNFSWIWVLSYLIVSLIYFIFARMKYSYIFLSKSTKESFLRPIAKYASMVVLGVSAYFIMGRVDSFMLTFFKGVEVVGLYETALPAASLVLLFTTPLQSFLFPIVSKLNHAGDVKSINYMLKAIYNMGLFISLPITIFFFFFSYEILVLLFGVNFSSASFPLKVLVIGFLFKSFTFINFSILQGLGKVKMTAKILYFGVGLNILLNLLFIPYQFFGFKLLNLGIFGAALATSISYLVMFLLSINFIQKGYTVSYNNWWKILLLNFLFGAVIFYLHSFILLHMYIYLLTFLIIATIIYLLLGHILKLVDYAQIIELVTKNEKK